MYICTVHKEQNNFKTLKNEKRNVKNSIIFWGFISPYCYNPFINTSTIQIMKNYLSKQKPQIITVAIAAAYFLINLIFR